MLRRLTIVLGVLAAAIASTATAADSDGTHSLDSVEHVQTEALDSAAHESTRTLDSVDDGHTEALDSVPAGQTEALDSVTAGQTEPLDAVAPGRTHTLDEAAQDRGWQPSDCSTLPVDLGAMPPASDSAAWSARLRAAQREVEQTEQRLGLANAAYSRSITHESGVGAVRAEIIQTRDSARSGYSRARCALPRLVEHARRAGVAAEILRPYL